MTDGSIPGKDVLRHIVLGCNEPVIFNGIINNDENWRLLELENFVELLGDKALPFRVTENPGTIVNYYF